MGIKEINLKELLEESEEVLQRKERISMLLNAFPTPDDGPYWEELSGWEKNFVGDIREYFDTYGTLSIAQEEVLERIWAKL